jgi:hypothetical protein
MRTQNRTNETHHTTSTANVLVPLAATDDPALLKRAQLARAINVSARTLDTWQKQKRIPFLKLSARCVRYHLPSVLRALRKFEIRETGL